MLNLLSVLLLLLFYPAPALLASDFGALLNRAEEHLEGWQAHKAYGDAVLALGAASNDAEQSLAREMLSRAAFFKGDYLEALRHAEESKRQGGMGSMFPYLRKAVETWARFNEVLSEHFALRFIHPKDEVLVHYALSALEKSYDELGSLLGIKPEERVIVEIYPTLESFTHATTLTYDEVRTTGVVGVCNFGRIMVLSPRLLPKGYPWLDTLSHEYVHYLLFVGGRNRVPVWLHEGTAKYFEKRWRGEGDWLSPLHETLLVEALQTNSLVPLSHMHPSFAKLPSSKHSQLAFAEVSSMVAYLEDRWGKGAVPRLIKALGDGVEFEHAFRELTGLGIAEFTGRWEQNLRKKGLQARIPKPIVKELQFAEEHGDSKRTDLRDVEVKEAKDHVLLGDLLSARGRHKAAAYEFKKALYFDPTSPVIANRLAGAKIAHGDFKGARDVLLKSISLYPDYFDSHLNLGRSYEEAGEWESARLSYESALAINPFSPELHARLASIYEGLGLREEALRQKKMLEILTR
ncbi:MAG: tetratricopeptide repeat protein [Candidatus Caldarchaeum sp.]